MAIGALMKIIRLLKSIGLDHVHLEPGTEIALDQMEAARLVHAGIAVWAVGPTDYHTAVIEPQEKRTGKVYRTNKT
jgi:hypothetical protein